MKNRMNDVSNAVLENYLKSSPSKLPIDDQEFRKKHFLNRERLFQDHLKLPLRLFNDAELLDLGCGTGEQDLVYADWGANLTLVDMNPDSINELKGVTSMVAGTESS